MKKKKSPKYVASGTYGNGGPNGMNPDQQPVNNVPPVYDYSSFISDPNNQDILQQYQKQGYKYYPTADGKGITFERPTGQVDYSKGFKIANTAMDLITGTANRIGDLKDHREQYKQYLESIQPQIASNKDQEGRNDSPIFYKNGGIHIKKSHKGLFTKKAKAAGMSVQEYAAHVLSSDSASEETRKQAQFAKNAAGFSHAYGGGAPRPIMAEAGEVYQSNQGGIAKIPDNMDTHDDPSGGVQVNDAFRVLEDTGDKRSDIPSKLLKLDPSEVFNLTGAKTNKTLTHSKAFEYGAKNSDRLFKKTERVLQTNVDNIKQSPNDNYAKNSLELNFKRLDSIPTRGEIFDRLFANQEQVKQKYNINNPAAKAQFGEGPGDPKEGDTKIVGTETYVFSGGRWTPMGNPAFNKKFAETLGQVTGDPSLTQPTPDMNPYASSLSEGAQEQAQGDPMFTTTPFTPGAGDPRTPGRRLMRSQPAQHALFQNINFPESDVITPPYDEALATNQDNTDYKVGKDIAGLVGKSSDTTKGRGRTMIPSPSSGFNAPLKWYDTATPTVAFIDALRRRSVHYNGAQFTAPQAKYINPLPQLQEGQRDYNAALSTLPDNGAGYANAGDIFSKKYAMDNQILGNTANINNGIWNQNEQARVNTKNAQSQSDQQSREVFDNKIAMGVEAQRQQLLRSMNDITTTIGQNAKYNREGSLLMKLFPNYNQQGNYNGNPRYLTNPTGQVAAQQKIDLLEKQGIKLTPSQKLAILMGTK